MPAYAASSAPAPRSSNPPDAQHTPCGSWRRSQTIPALNPTPRKVRPMSAMTARIRTTPSGGGTPTRGLTHSLDSTKEGLGMEPTRDCLVIATSQGMYQMRARLHFEKVSDADLQPHAWIVTTCDQQCLNPAHMTTHVPVRIAYPAGVCIYCGDPAGTKDHIVPNPGSGAARRQFVATVPACGECNSSIKADGSPNVGERRRIAHARLRRRKSKVLSAPDWTDDELAEYGPSLRQFMVRKKSEKAGIKARLTWPDDPFYDMRAFQKSKIGDPLALGLIDDPFKSATPEDLRKWGIEDRWSA